MSKKLSILSFNSVADSEAGSELEIKRPDGSGTGLFFTVLGSSANVVLNHTNIIVRQYRAKESIAKKSGKEVPFEAQENLDQNAESAAVRVTGWRGVDEPFEAGLLAKVLRQNPEFSEQIVAFSSDLANFTKKA